MQFGQHPARVGQTEFLERTVGQHTAPAVKHHHRLGAGLNLGVEVKRHRVGVDLQHLVHQVRAAVHHGLDQPVVVRAGAFHHVAGQRPGAAGKTNQGHPAIQCLADGGDGVEHITQLVHVGHFEFGDSGLVAHRVGKFGAFTQRKRQPQAHGIGHGQDVAEQYGGVNRKTLKRLQRDFRGVVGVGCQAHEAAGFGACGAVFRQKTPGLAHHPDRCVVGGLTQAGAQEGVVLQGGVGGGCDG